MPPTVAHLPHPAVHTDALPLPGVLAEIERVADRDAALMLAGERGGMRVYLPGPRYLAAGHWLVTMLGWAKAVAVCELVVFQREPGAKGHGGMIDIPKADQIVRRIKVRWMTLAGVSASKIAFELGVSERLIQRIRATLRAAGEIE